MTKLKKTALFFTISGILLITAAVLLQLFTPLGGFHIETSRDTAGYDNVRELVVVSGSIPVEVSVGEGDKCVVSHVSDLPVIISHDDTGVLHITQDDSFTLSLFPKDKKDYVISVQLPEKQYGRISLAGSGGNITVHDRINCETLEISTKTGDITLKNADHRAKIKSTGGNIKLAFAALEKDMTINGGEGDVTIQVSEEMPFFMEFATDSGWCTATGFGENDINGCKGDAALLSGKGGRYLEINTTSGNLTLENISQDKKED